MVRALLIGTTDGLGHHGCTLVNRQLVACAKAAGIEITSRVALDGAWDRAVPDRCDLVIVNGEGTLHGDSKGARLIGGIPAWARQRRLPAFLINTVYQDVPAAVAAQIAGYDAVYTRDRLSLELLQAAGITASVAPDLSLTWEPPHSSSGTAVVVNGSTRKSVRRELYKLSVKTNARYLPILARPIENIERTIKYRRNRALSLFAPRGSWRARYRSAIPEFDDFANWLSRKAGLIITGRFHMATIALCLEVPVIAVASNTHKMEALFSEIGLAHRLSPSVGAIPARIADLRYYSDDELAAIRQHRARARNDARRMFSMIAADVAARSATIDPGARVAAVA